jgi:phosphate:Na+ symporter
VFGCLIAYPFIRLGWFSTLVQVISPWELGPTTIASSIAIAHTIFNVTNSAIFLPMSSLLAKITIRLVPERPGDAAVRPLVLERHLLDTPELALQQTRREIVRMAKTAKLAVMRSISSIIDDDMRKLQSVRETEDFIDTFQLAITSYLSSLSSRRLSDEVSIELPVLLHTVNDLERVGDHAVNIVEVAERKIEQKLAFSEYALAEAEQLNKLLDQMFDRIIAALEKNDTESAISALSNENNLNKLQLEFRRSHVQRMTEGICSPETGLIFIDLVDNVEKIGDHLNNIAQAVLGGLQWMGVKPRITIINGD